MNNPELSFPPGYIESRVRFLPNREQFTEIATEIEVQGHSPLAELNNQISKLKNRLPKDAINPHQHILLEKVNKDDDKAIYYSAVYDSGRPASIYERYELRKTPNGLEVFDGAAVTSAKTMVELNILESGLLKVGLRALSNVDEGRYAAPGDLGYCQALEDARLAVERSSIRQRLSKPIGEAATEYTELGKKEVKALKKIRKTRGHD